MSELQCPGEAVTDGRRITMVGGHDNADIARTWRVDGERVGHVKIHGVGSTAFGEIPVAEPTPLVQMQWPYNINTVALDWTEEF